MTLSAKHLAGGLITVLTLSACGAAAATSGAAGTQPSGTAAAGAGRGPAASGTVAAIAGTTMQVQSQQNGQVAVTWTGTTAFTQAVATTLAAVKVGDCVTATSTGTAASTGTASDSAAFTATTLVVSKAVHGTCGFAGGGGPGGFPGGAPPSGAQPSEGAQPSGPPPSGSQPSGSFASGKVTAVSGSTLTVAARQQGSATATPSTVDRTVTVAASTKITTDAATTASSLKVGRCVSAQGSSDSSGTVAATSVRISDPTNGQCGGFGGGRNGG